MSAPPPGHPLAVSVLEDVSDSFLRDPASYDLELALIRAGNLSIDLTGGKFEITFTGRNFRPGPPGIINVSATAAFQLVQSCRGAWDKAIEATETKRPNPGGAGQEIYRPYENEWKNPVDEATFKTLAGKLAVAGNDLFINLFERNKGTELDQIAADLRALARAGSCALTVNAADFHIPWRMLYTHPHDEKLAANGTNFDPAGFWGYQHIIEQFTKKYRISDHVVARNNKLALGAALHERIDTEFHVDCIKRHRDFIQSSAAQLAYTEWTTKDAFLSGMAVDPFDQQVLYLLCHAEGAGAPADPSLAAPLIELSDNAGILADDIRRNIADKFKPSPPLVFINACRGGQLNTLVRQNFTFASELLEQGAICVVGPQIEVPAVFAGEFGKQFCERFIAQAKPPPQSGIVLRDVTRAMWEQRNPFGLIYSLYAGADCHIRWLNEEASS